MKQRKRETLQMILPALGISLIGLVFYNVAFACECHRRNDFEKEFNSSKAVFVGQVVEIENSRPDALVTFKIERIWKGAKTKKIIIRTNNQGKACGYVFTQGEKYLVYAYDDGALRTGICSRTAEVKSAVEDLKKLEDKRSENN